MKTQWETTDFEETKLKYHLVNDSKRIPNKYGIIIDGVNDNNPLDTLDFQELLLIKHFKYDAKRIPNECGLGIDGINIGTPLETTNFEDLVLSKYFRYDSQRIPNESGHIIEGVNDKYEFETTMYSEVAALKGINNFKTYCNNINLVVDGINRKSNVVALVTIKGKLEEVTLEVPEKETITNFVRNNKNILKWRF